MTNKTCKMCAKWCVPNDDYYDSGVCRSAWVFGDREQDDWEPRGVFASISLPQMGGVLITGPDFGCIHHEEKASTQDLTEPDRSP